MAEIKDLEDGVETQEIQPRKGRPPGVTEALHRGEGRVVKLLAKAIALLGEDNEAVQELMAIELAIARGEPGFTGRHTGTRLKACADALDRLIGKATQRVEVGGQLDLHALVARSMEEGDKLPTEKPEQEPHTDIARNTPSRKGSQAIQEAPLVALSPGPEKPITRPSGDAPSPRAFRAQPPQTLPISKEGEADGLDKTGCSDTLVSHSERGPSGGRPGGPADEEDEARRRRERGRRQAREVLP